MPVKTVTLDVVALTADANAKLDVIRENTRKLVEANPIELKVKLETAGARAEMAVLRKEINNTTGDKQSGVLGLFQAFSKLGGSLGGSAGIAGGLVAVGGALGPILVGATQAAAALIAAGAGVAAFGALSIPQFTAISGALTQISADTATYERATTKASKATALKKIKSDWADITGPQRQAVHGIQSLGAEFVKLSNKLAPVTFKVFNEGLKIAAQLLPDLLPFARAAGNAIDGLLKSFDAFTKTQGFKAFLAQLLALSGPAITALGQGMGKIAVSLGKLILVAAQPNSIKVLSGLLTVLAGTIDVITFVIGRASGKIVEWKNDFGDIGRVVNGVARDISDWVKNTVNWAQDTARAFGTAQAGAAGFGRDVAAAFGDARHAVATAGHDIAGAFDAVRRTFAGVGHSIADTFDAVRHAQGQFDAFGKDITFVRHVITDAFDGIRHGGAIAFDALRHILATEWDQIWSNTTATLGKLRHDVAAAFAGLRHDAATILDALRHDIAAAWDHIWSTTNSQAQTGTGNIVDWFRKLPGRVLGALTGLGHQLYAFAHAALDDFLAGLKAVAGSVFSWVGNFVATIWDKVKKFFGIHSPSSLFYGAGKNLMLGLFHGIKDHAHLAANAARSAANAIGAQGGPTSASAGQAQAYARSRLGAYGWSSSQMSSLISLWNQESGWNRLARNPTSGAYGIPQALPASKMGAAANPPTSSAAAQINWGLGYIKSVYGSPAGAESHEISAGWYDRGGWLPTGLSLALNTTGRPERVGGHGGNTYNVNVMVPANANKADIGRVTVEAIKEFERRSGSGWRN